LDDDGHTFQVDDDDDFYSLITMVLSSLNSLSYHSFSFYHSSFPLSSLYYTAKWMLHHYKTQSPLTLHIQIPINHFHHLRKNMPNTLISLYHSSIHTYDVTSHFVTVLNFNKNFGFF